jgi:hypothetical protein
MPNPGDGALWPVSKWPRSIHLIRSARLRSARSSGTPANAAARPGYVGGNCGPDLLVTFDSDARCDAVVKVPPPVGCVKYKAQHIVLPMQIPLFLACYKAPLQNWPGTSVDFPKRPLQTRVFTLTATGIPKPARNKPAPPAHATPNFGASAPIETRLPTTPPQGAELVHPLWTQRGKVENRPPT